jgi:two-component system cell cycle response regulator
MVAPSRATVLRAAGDARFSSGPRELRADLCFPRLPVVAVTASAILGDRERAIAAGFDSYIAKPINLIEVRKQAEILLSSSSRLGK